MLLSASKVTREGQDTATLERIVTVGSGPYTHHGRGTVCYKPHREEEDANFTLSLESKNVKTTRHKPESECGVSGLDQVYIVGLHERKSSSL